MIPVCDWTEESLSVDVKDDVEDVCEVWIAFCQMSSDIPNIEAVT